MYTSVFGTKQASTMGRVRRRRRLVGAVVALLALVAGSMTWASSPAVAGPVDTNWVATGPGTVTTSSNGSATPAAMSYSMNPVGLGVTRSWDFTATATAAATAGDPIKVPYTWQGLHAWFQVTARLDMIVNGVVVQTLENHGPVSCCTTPSNGFVYGGVATFSNVPAGATYGFRMSGSNGDFNNFLQGSLILSIKPYLDATIGQDNRDWPGAEDISTAPASSRRIGESGEARWFKFPVVPGQDVSVSLKGLLGDDALPADYDLALYGDVGAAFDQLVDGDPVAQLASTSAASGVTDTQVPQFPAETATIPTRENPPTGQQFAPHVYSPHVYSPHVYSPHVYSPHVYSPHVYSPRVFTPGSYIPANVSDSSLSDAFSAAQNQALLAASTNTGTADETVSASSGNTTGFFYVRVEGHGDADFDANEAFQLNLTSTGNPACTGLQTFPKDYADAPASPTQQTVIVTDTNRLGLSVGTQEYTDYLDSLGDLATSTDGVVVNVADSQQVRDLWTQVAGHVGCPTAVNMVAAAIKDIVDDWRNDNSKYVVVAGGDEVIPFFRYQDISGLGPESSFSPPVLENTPSGASLNEDQVQSQDAYGSDLFVTIGGVTVPLPDLAVGRLVKTPEEIEGTVANFLTLPGHALPAPDTSLVTGYDFLADAADAVNTEFSEALPAGATTDTLITHPDANPPETPWTGSDLGDALLNSHHDVVYLAGHFSANDTLAADFQTAFSADELDPADNPGKLLDTLVLSAGCHSGYNIVNTAAVPPTGTSQGTNTFDWTERMAQQKAVLIGGTGYQYGDTDFLEYSERLYLDIARRLHEGPSTGDSPAIPVGRALTLAKQDYLASLTSLTGIDQKAMLEATLYGLPMTGFDAPRRSPLPTETSTVSTTQVPAGTVGAAFGLATAQLPVTTNNSGQQKTVVAGGQTLQLKWLDGTDGVTIQPGVPAIPKQIKDVTVSNKVLRGVGLWSGDYTDQGDELPLTGAPAIEGATPNSTFESDHFFPQRLATVNYFGELGGDGRTSLILNPAQYKTDPSSDPSLPRNILRNYNNLDMRLFYSPKSINVPPGQSDPTLAAPPAISDVTGTVADGVVTFSARVAGDPSAGVQQVWVTWTGLQGGAGHGQWRSVLLTQHPDDSTLWTGTLNLPNGQPFAGVRFLVQAVNGVGVVGMDVAEGDGYAVTLQGAVDTAVVNVQTANPTASSPLGVTAHVATAAGVPVSGRSVRFTVLQGGASLFETTATTGSGGNVVLVPPAGTPTPTKLFTVVASIFGSDGQVSASDTALDVDTATIGLETGTRTTSSPLGVTAVVKDASAAPWQGRTVRWTVSRGGTTLYTYTATTDANGRASVTGNGGGIPGGALVVTAELLDLGATQVKDSASTAVTGPLTITPTPTFLVARAGSSIGTLTAKISDGRGNVAGVSVTFTLPSGSPGATFASGPNTTSPTTATVVTNANGLATSPAMTAKSTVGSFNLTISADGANTIQVPMSAQYGFTAFGSPVNESKVNNTSPTTTTPLKTTALLADGSKLSDAAAAALVQAGRVQVRWQEVGTTTWVTQANLVTYDAGSDLFQANLKPTSLGWVKGKTYTVQLRILAATGDLQTDFDLGSRTVTFLVK
jgi:hypothetical protein